MNSNLSTNLADDKTASDVFKDLLRQKKDARAAALDVIKANPSSALAALQRGDSVLGLSPKGSADVLDDVLGLFANPLEARQLMNDHLTPERQVELIQARGDLPAVVTDIADMQLIVDAIREEIGATKSSAYITEGASAPAEEEEEDDDEDEEGAKSGNLITTDSGYVPYLIIRSWAMKLKDRADYTQFLDEEFGKHPMRRWLTIAVWYESHCPTGEDEDTLLAEFDQFGLDPAEALAELKLMIEDHVIPHLDVGEVEESRIEFSQRRKNIENTATITDEVRAAKEEAQNAAEDIDI